MASLTLSYDKAIEFLGWLRLHADLQPGDLNLLCLQGLVPDTATTTNSGGASFTLVENVHDTYNDSIIMVYRGEDGVGRVVGLLGTVDPGAYWTQNSPKTVAHLGFGQHLYKKGRHRNSYDALVPAEKTPIWRDTNRNARLDLDDQTDYGNFSINVHAGSTTTKVGMWSAGCLNICGGPGGEPYQTFLSRVNAHVAGRVNVRVTVWQGSDLVAFLSAGWAHHPWVQLSTWSPWVAEIQQRLVAHGHAIHVDADFGPQTRAAVVAFQQAMGLSLDGVVGPETWERLLGSPVSPGGSGASPPAA